MKKKELQMCRGKLLPELEQELREHRKHLLDLRFDLAAGKVKNIQEIRKVKKTIAQLLTVAQPRTERNAKRGLKDLHDK